MPIPPLPSLPIFLMIWPFLKAWRGEEGRGEIWGLNMEDVTAGLRRERERERESFLTFQVCQASCE